MRGMDLSRVLRIQTSLLFERAVGSYGRSIFYHTAKCYLGLEYFIRTIFFKNFV